MNRYVRTGLLGVLFFCLTGVLPAQTDPDAAKLRAAGETLLQSGLADDKVKAAEMLDKASQMDARAVAAGKPAESSFWDHAVQITPFLTFALAAVGFLYNSEQKRKDTIRQQAADKEKRQDQQAADEEKRFNDTVDRIQKGEDFSPAAALLSSYTHGPFADRARKLATGLLLQTKSYDNFKLLFQAFVDVSPANLEQVVGLLRSVHQTVGPLLTRANADPNALSAEERPRYDLLVAERIFLGTQVATILKLPRTSLDPLDLSDLGFDGTDLTGADLRNAVITPAVWNWMNLDGVDLRGINSFQNVWLYDTAWWHASHIDGPLLDFLATHFPFKEDQRPNSQQEISQKDYDDHLVRLRGKAVVAEK